MADFSSILISLEPSLEPIQKLASGLAYMLGLLFAIKAIQKFKEVGNFHAQGGGGRAKLSSTFGYLLGAMALLFLPSMVDLTRVTLFGVASPLEYKSWFNDLIQQYGNSTYVVTKLIETAGVIWFIRGCVLLVNSTEPGSSHGSKGLAFLVAGIFAINFMYTATFVESTMDYVTKHILELYPAVQKPPS